MQQLIPGYDPKNAPGIALPDMEHRSIPNLRGEYIGTARQLLARDIRNLRAFTNAPNARLKELIDLKWQMYPEAFSK